ncbi:hypothetical protein HAX54_012845 [Datura stramonium]|uniref:Uncharacterized protein n=1 Tax=Datura stramonium TaxID=4076 RepID=A0ABS8TKF8_DATST|nr:hypothetical protein [Datura stramonium]
MALPATSQPPPKVGQTISLKFQTQFPTFYGSINQNNKPTVPNMETSKISMAQILQQSTGGSKGEGGLPTIITKEATLINGEHVIKWIEVDVAKLDLIENLNYAIIRKFSDGGHRLKN